MSAAEVSRRRESLPLPDLAQRIAHEHEQCQAAFGKALDHALAAGELLLEAKQAVAHGRWLPWLEANFAGSARTAQGYMRLASNPQRVSHLTVRGALKQLAEPRSIAVRARTQLERARELLDRGELPAAVRETHEANALLLARAAQLDRDLELADLPAAVAVASGAGEVRALVAEHNLRVDRIVGLKLAEYEAELARLAKDPDLREAANRALRADRDRRAYPAFEAHCGADEPTDECVVAWLLDVAKAGPEP